MDTVTFGSTDGHLVYFCKLQWGVGTKNNSNVGENEAGIVGLVCGGVTLISKICLSICSCCQVAFLSRCSSNMNLGSKGVVSGCAVVSTPLVSRNPHTFYFLVLTGEHRMG